MCIFKIKLFLNYKSLGHRNSENRILKNKNIYIKNYNKNPH